MDGSNKSEDGWDGLYVDVQASFERKLREMGDRVRGISWFSSRAAAYRENLVGEERDAAAMTHNT